MLVGYIKYLHTVVLLQQTLCAYPNEIPTFVKKIIFILLPNIFITSFIGLHFGTNTNAHTFCWCPQNPLSHSNSVDYSNWIEEWTTHTHIHTHTHMHTLTHTHTCMVTYTHTRNTYSQHIVLSFYCFASAGTRALLKRVASIPSNYYTSHLTVWIKREMHLLAALEQVLSLLQL